MKVRSQRQIKTRRSFEGGFVQLGQGSSGSYGKERNYWIYVVCMSGRKTQIFEFPRHAVLPRIRPYIHYDFCLWEKGSQVRRTVRYSRFTPRSSAREIVRARLYARFCLAPPPTFPRRLGLYPKSFGMYLTLG